MTTNANTTAHESGKEPIHSDQHALRIPLRHMPGVVAVSIYMMILAGVDVVYVVEHKIDALYLILSAFFVAAALGLLLLLRWAWALSLAAVALLSALFLRAYFFDQNWAALEQGLINLVIFLYLVKTDLRHKLR
jgi:hypothetical protein